ncbi:MAG TPA: sulfotransferase domain-containing protein [Euzebyales bacterium]|nr:sulfotransferase domain-containing protein [Euzebyales bacterium]
MTVRRYTSPDEDSDRWRGFPFRDGDVVVSARSKHGTTWVQTILLLLIHGRPDLPAPVALLSPWLDHLVEPRDTVVSRLVAQRHRRVIKTHTPLHGVPVDPRAAYVVIARHPLDAAVSLYHQGDNIDRERLRQLVGVPSPPSSPRPPVREWLSAWVDHDVDPLGALDSLPGVLWHLSDAWSRRGHDHVVLVHYDDLLADLEGQMRRLAEALDIVRSPERWRDLVRAATFPAMRERAQQLAPDAGGILRDPRAFFRRGTSGAAPSCSGLGTWRATAGAPRRSPHRICLRGCTADRHRVAVAAAAPPASCLRPQPCADNGRGLDVVVVPHPRTVSTEG